MFWKFFEFCGNSLGILEEFWGILWEFLGNSLGILWEFYWNSSGIFLEFFGNSLRVLDTPLFFCFFRLPCIPNLCEKICNVCSFDGSPLVLLVVKSWKIFIRQNVDPTLCQSNFCFSINSCDIRYSQQLFWLLLYCQHCGNILEKFWSHLLFQELHSNYVHILAILL